MRLTDEELKAAFDEIRKLGAAIKPKTEYDSIVVMSCTQFSFVHTEQGLVATLALCDKLLDALVSDSAEKKALRRAVVTLRQIVEESLPS